MFKQIFFCFNEADQISATSNTDVHKFALIVGLKGSSQPIIVMNGAIEAGTVKHDGGELPSTYQTTITQDEETMMDESAALLGDATSPNNATENGWFKKKDMALKAAWVAVVLAALLVVGTFGQQQSRFPEMLEEPLANNVATEGVAETVDTLKSIYVEQSSEVSGFWGNGDELYIRYTDSTEYPDLEAVCSSHKYGWRTGPDYYRLVDPDEKWGETLVTVYLETGSTWVLNKKITHPGTLCVQLWENDFIYDDDFVGWAIISPSQHRYVMTGDGGTYILHTE